MPRDLKQLLEDTAARPTRPVDAHDIVRRAKRQRLARHAAASSVAVLAVLVVAFGATTLLDIRPDRDIAFPPQESSPLAEDADGEQRASAAVGLVGLWTVEPAGEDPDAVLRLDVPELGLFRDCGVIHGQWGANAEGLFVAGTAGWSGACGEGDPTPQWLLAAAAHRSDGDGHLLLNKTGAIVARLTPGDVPDVPPTVSESLARPPVLTDEDRRALAPAASLPAGLTPASRDALLGRWRPLDAPAGSDAHAHLHADQTWSGSDGCNGLGGRWRSGPDAAFLATGGPSTLIGCENVPVEQMLARAARAGFDGDVLVLVDRRGAPLGRFRPS